MRISFLTDRIELSMEKNGQNFDINTKGQVRDLQIQVQAKMQKIVTALYLVSDILKESEPIRARIRKLSIQVLSGVGDIGVLTPSRAKKMITETQNLIDQLQDMLRVSVSVGFVSDMNYKLISDSLSRVRDGLNQQFSLLNSEHSFQGSSSNRGVQEFILPKDVVEGLSAENIRDFNKGQLKDNKGQSVVSFIKRTEKPKEEKLVPGGREEMVLNFLKGKTEASVSDVAAEFPETSEKTIQRLLVKMVDQGVLEKTGEKRWSRYSLKS